MTCDELLNAMNEYVDGPIDSAVCEQFARHLSGCNPCQVVVDNIRQTIRLYRDGQPYEIADAFDARLHSALRDRWKSKLPPAATHTPVHE